MSDNSYDRIITDNSHETKNDDGQSSAVRPDVDSSVHVYIVLWFASDSLFILNI